MAQRLDVYLLENNLVESREKGRALIMEGVVFVDNQKADKPGFQVKDGQKVELRGETLKYVSRGGLKLEKAMGQFGISLDNMICADIGASTGGFCDCMLQNGAKRVYAVDVGYGQLAWKLRNDDRVVNLERTNFRYCTKEQICEELDFASVDVSFISLTKILPVLYTLLKPEAQAVCLIKPQFEAGREKVGKKGVVREASTHLEVVNKIIEFSLNSGFCVLNIEFSPIKGPQGNIEYLIHLVKRNGAKYLATISADELINKSHIELS